MPQLIVLPSSYRQNGQNNMHGCGWCLYDQGAQLVMQVHYERTVSPIPSSVLTHRADNTTSCDAFLCDVKLAASGLRGTAQDV